MAQGLRLPAARPAAAGGPKGPPLAPALRSARSPPPPSPPRPWRGVAALGFVGSLVRVPFWVPSGYAVRPAGIRSLRSGDGRARLPPVSSKLETFGAAPRP